MDRFAPVILAAALAAPQALSAAYEEINSDVYPDADSVLVDGLEDVAYAPDGTYSVDSVNTIKILTEKGRREEGVLDVTYNARYGEAEIVGVSLVLDDGTELPVDVSGTVKESSENSSASENIYDPMKRKISCSVPGLKIGDTIRYRTRRKVLKSRVKDVFASTSVLEWSCPIVRQRVRVVAPKERPLVRMEVRNPLGNVGYSAETAEDGSTVHLWTATNSPQAFAEPDMPPLHTQVQRVKFSTASDWREISRWYSDVCEPHLARTSPAISNKVHEILASLPAGESPMDAVRAIYRWVSQEIRYMGLTMEDTAPGYAPHDVDVTFDNRYGVCRDKAALLAAMLKIAGFDAHPVLIHAGAKMDPDVPEPYFNHAITAIAAPGDPAADANGFILMDPTNESSRDIMPAYLGDKSYLVATPEGEPLHVSRTVPPEANAVALETKCSLDADGCLTVDCDARFAGIGDNMYRSSLLRKRKDDRRRLFESIVRGMLPGAELVSFEVEPADLRDTEKPLSIRFLAKTGDFAVRGETLDEIPLPLMSRVIGSANWILDGSTSLTERRFPLVVDSTAMVSERLRLEYGDALGEPAYVPERVGISGPYSYRLDVSAGNGVLEAERAVSVCAVEFPPQEYGDLREGIVRAEAAERKRPSFAHDPCAGADVRILRKSCDCTVYAPDSWTVTNTVVKKILTYRGKKKSSELKFAFNPEWKKVELLYATVSNANGSVASAGERETSLFDCRWASSAPRYPASKELVVNLPAVEIGSVVSYATVTSVSNAPAPFRADWYFDSEEPVDEIAVAYRDWRGEEWSRTVRPAKRVRPEPMAAASPLWRDVRGVSHGDFGEAADRLRAASDVAPVAGEPLAEALGGIDADSPAPLKLKRLRDWMAKYVRVAGPSLYETPLEAQQTPPETVLRERYASRFDYVRTLCALARGAGLDADIVFASGDAAADPAIARRDMEDLPDVEEFSTPLCRVKARSGGFLFWGGTETEYFAGTENEHSPMGASVCAHSHYLDPSDGGFKTVEAATPAMESREDTVYEIGVRENGAVDLDYERVLHGPEAGAFRKLYAEMLPEDRLRHFQTLLGDFSQSATATRELMTDVEGYPAVLRFSAYAPDYAVVAGDAISVAVPSIGFAPFPIGGSPRENPVGLSRKDAGSITVKISFPKGYDTVEIVPDGYVFKDPVDGERLYGLSAQTAFDEDGCLVVTLKRERFAHGAKTLPREYAALLKDFTRMASSRSNRTVTVRRSRVAETR